MKIQESKMDFTISHFLHILTFGFLNNSIIGFTFFIFCIFELLNFSILVFSLLSSLLCKIEVKIPREKCMDLNIFSFIFLLAYIMKYFIINYGGKNDLFERFINWYNCISSILHIKNLNSLAYLTTKNIWNKVLVIDDNMITNETITNVLCDTENYSKNTGFRSNKSRHCTFIIYRVKTRFKKRHVI